MKKVNILGQTYTVEIKKYNQDIEFKEKELSGYCSVFDKRIVVCDMGTYPGYDQSHPEINKNSTNETLRHEIVHAFLYESGLDSCSHTLNNNWGLDEEIVDWFAIQSPKIYKVFEQLNIL